jgi:hypothetical protein
MGNEQIFVQQHLLCLYLAARWSGKLGSSPGVQYLFSPGWAFTIAAAEAGSSTFYTEQHLTGDLVNEYISGVENQSCF